MSWIQEVMEQNVFGFNPMTGSYDDVTPSPPSPPTIEPLPQPVKEKKKEEYIPVHIIKKLEARGEYTDDFHIIRRHKHVPVFIYQQELLRNGKHSDILIPSKSKWLGEAYSSLPHFDLFDIGDQMPRRTMAFTSTAANGNLLKGTCLKGEMFALCPEAVLNLDRYMQNTEESDRVEKTFTLTQQQTPFKDGQYPTIKAWVYLGHLPFFDKIKMVKRSTMKDYTLNKWYFIP